MLVRVIVGPRVTKEPIDLASCPWDRYAFADRQIIDALSSSTSVDRDNDTALRAEPLDRERYPGGRCVHSPPITPLDVGASSRRYDVTDSS